jgi:molybdopterin molybdotransferase
VPAAALVIFEMFVRPLLRRLAGETPPSPLPARIGSPCPSEVGREDYLRVHLAAREGTLWAEPVPGGALRSVMEADALAVIPAERPALAAGDPVDVYPLG